MPKMVAVGTVVSDKMNKTRRVEIPRLVKDPMYGKYIRRRTVCFVHDEENVSKTGDTVEIEECPPVSKKKRWKLLRIVQEGNVIDLIALRAASKAEAEAAEAAESEANDG